jgi:hypothetical protein
MLDIKFIPIEGSEYFNIVVNGVKEINPYNNRGFAEIKNKEIYDELIHYSPEEVFNYFYSFSFDYLDFVDQDISVYVYDVDSSTNEPMKISVCLGHELTEWDKGFTFGKFTKAFDKVFSEANQNIVGSYLIDVENVLGVSFYFDHYYPVLKDHIDLCLHEFDSLVKSACLIAANDGDSFVSVFDFPKSIKTPCQQYLMYFGQFLGDLGIEVETELKEQAHSTLFSITPKDKDEALDKIREALDIYINAPALNNNSFLQIENQDVAFMQMQANVMHLKSQILFSNAALQMKDATIEALQLSNYQLKQLKIGHETSDKRQDEESVIEGIVSVKKFEGKGFSVNTPEILRKLKRVFRKTND